MNSIPSQDGIVANTQNSFNTPVKSSGRGRTKGSFSFITLSGEQLAKYPNVVVSRKWAEAIGIGSDAVAKSSIETLKGTPVASATETAEPLSATVEL